MSTSGLTAPSGFLLISNSCCRGNFKCPDQRKILVSKKCSKMLTRDAVLPPWKASRSKMAGGRVAHVTLKGPSVVKELVIATILGCAVGGLWKMHHWNEQRRTRAFCNYLTNCLSAHPNYLLKKPVENSLRDAKLSFNDIDEVILVGGSTRIPAVQGIVNSLTGKEPNVTVNPDEVVTLGATVQIKPVLIHYGRKWNVILLLLPHKMNHT